MTLRVPVSAVEYVAGQDRRLRAHLERLGVYDHDTDTVDGLVAWALAYPSVTATRLMGELLAASSDGVSS